MGGISRILHGLPILIMVLVLLVRARPPRCRDSTPPRPLKPIEGRPLFCYHYANSSCCSAEEDREVFADYMAMLWTPIECQEVAQRRCSGLLFHLACTRCDPYAAYMFDVKQTASATNSTSFPGLCPTFCKLFFAMCHDFVRSITNDPNLLKLASDPTKGEQFCRAVAITDSVYCYPDLLTNRALQAQLTDSVVTTPKSHSHLEHDGEGDSEGDDSDNGDRDGCICLKEVATALRNPLMMTSIPDGSGRFVVVEQTWGVRLYTNDWVEYPTPFLDITDPALRSAWGEGAWSLFNIVFHPGYATNGRFFCYFGVTEPTSDVTDEGQQIYSSELREFAVDPANTDRADTASGLLLIRMFQLGKWHVGGGMFFGADGYLYLFTGDGGVENDPYNLAQNRGSLNGKAMRIDVGFTRSDEDGPYSIPPDNPFINTWMRQEIYAYGLRSPWRCSMDPGDRQTGNGKGRIFCGDVGGSAFEEVDIIQKGGNHGWRRREGFACFNPPNNCDAGIPAEVLPIFAYNRTVGKAVIGGYVYRGCVNPALNGAYIFGDFVTGRLMKLEEDPSGWSDSQIRTCSSDRCEKQGLTNSRQPNIFSFGEDEEGELYIMASKGYDSNNPVGKVYKIIDPNRPGNSIQCRPKS